MVLRQRDSMVVVPMVPTVGAEIADLECAPSAEEMASTEGQAPAAVVAAHGVCRAAPAPVTEHSPTTTYAAPDTVIGYVAPACIFAAPASADVTERWRDADMSESMSEMSEGAAVNGDGLLDTVFDALVELAGGYGRDWVPVRQIHAQTSLQLERLRNPIEEWE